MEKQPPPKPYQNPQRLMFALIILFICIMVMNVASVTNMLFGILSSAAAELDNKGSASASSVFESLMVLIGSMEALLTIVTGFVFVFWMTRIRENMHSLGVTGLKHTVSDCLSAFFIPIINLYKPYAISQELWKANSENAVTPDQSKSSSLIKWWWGLWLFTLVGNRVADVMARTMKPEADPNIALMLCLVMMLTESVSFTAAFLALTVVRKLTQRQEQKHALVVATLPPDIEPQGQAPQIIG